MRKNVFGRRLKRDRNERKALFKSLLSALVIHGRIKTTEEKAKAIKGQAEKLITKAKKGQAVANLLQEYLTPESIKKLITEVAPAFTTRQGGYTRIIKLGRRFSDNAAVVLLEWVEQSTKNLEQKTQNKEKAQKQTEIVESKVEESKTKKAKKPTKKVETKKVTTKKKTVKKEVEK